MKVPLEAGNRDKHWVRGEIGAGGGNSETSTSAKATFPSDAGIPATSTRSEAKSCRRREMQRQEDYKGIPSEEPPAESNIRGVLEASKGLKRGGAQQKRNT